MIQGNIEKVNNLQNLSYKIYLQTINNIKEGMNEVEIAAIITKLCREKGIENFWYDVSVMVLVGEERFLEMVGDYQTKSPSDSHCLRSGDTLHIDLTPMDKEGFWGDFSASCIFQPRTDLDFEKVEFLKLVRKIQRDGIKHITAETACRNITAWYLEKFKDNDITLVDVRNTVGHSMHQGAKKFPNGREKRVFLDLNNTNSLKEGIFAIEPGGYRKSRLDKNKIVVGRFEDCIYVSSGAALLLGHKKEIPYIC